MVLVSSVSTAVAFFAIVMAFGITALLFAVGAAKWSVNWFRT